MARWLGVLGGGLLLVAATPAAARHTQSSLDTFIVDHGERGERIMLEGRPTSAQLDRLLPRSATGMVRVALLCRVASSGRLVHCRRDHSIPFQSGDIAAARRALAGTLVAVADRARMTAPGIRLQAVVYLDDPTRPLDRFNPNAVPTVPPPPPPLADADVHTSVTDLATRENRAPAPGSAAAG